MSSAPLVRDPDLNRLLDDGYDVVVEEGHLIIRQLPFVNEAKEISYGFLTYPVTVTGDRIVSGTDHRIWFGGGTPCDEHGNTLPMANPEVHAMSDGRQAGYMLSSKPGPTGYPDEYTKVTSYARMVSHPAQALNPSVTLTPGAAWLEVGSDSPFNYLDTASSRAGLTALNSCFENQVIAIVGLGGTGSYILDQVAKTPVRKILLIDGDTFENHNAFRAPGAPSLQTLRRRPMKVQYFADIYSQMHRGVTPVPLFLDAETKHVLDEATFVFVATDDAVTKQEITAYLEKRDTPFIDVGMGIEEVDGKLTGLLRVTTSLPGRRDHVHQMNRIPGPAPERDDYARNIQIADLNALNAQMAVMRWKRHVGFYADLTNEGFTTFAVAVNEIANEDIA